MLKVTLREEEVKVVKSYVTSLKTADTKALGMFEMVSNLFNRYKKEAKTKEVKKAVNKAINDLYEEQDTNISNYLRKVVNTSIDYQSFNIAYKDDKGITKLTYKTIENIVKLLQFISDNEKDTVNSFQEVREIIDSELNADFLSKVNYNNSINKRISEIKQANNIKGEDDALAFVPDIKQLILGINKAVTDEDTFNEALEALMAQAEALGLNKQVA